MSDVNTSSPSPWRRFKRLVLLFLALLLGVLVLLVQFKSPHGYFFRYVSGYALLRSTDTEDDGYGLYSYLLLTERPPASDQERILSIINSVTHLPPVESLKAKVSKKRLNVVYLPIRGRANSLPNQSNGILDDYDFERASTFLRRLSIPTRRGPYLVSTLSPISKGEKHESYLLQDLSDVNSSVANIWISQFGSEAAKPRYWEPAVCNRVARNLRIRIAERSPESAEGLNDWLVYFPNSSSSAIVRVAVDAEFDDSKESVSKLQALLNFLPPSTAIRVHPSASLELLIQDHYGVTKKRLPQTYALLEAAILRLNLDLQKPYMVPIAIPNIPHRVTGLGSNRFDRYLMSIVQEGQPGTYVGNPGSKSSVVLVDYKLAENELASGERQTFLAENRPSFLAHPMGVKWESSDGVGKNPGGRLLSDAVTATIRQKLAASPGRQVAVFVVDSGWPGKAYEDSHVELFHMFDVVRAKWKMTKANRFPFPPFQAASNKHCEEIESSLQDFRELDPGKQIKVMYIPLSLEQGAESVLSELLTLHFIYESRAGFDFRRKPPPQSVLDDANQKAKTTLAQLPAKAEDPKIKTDQAILQGLYEIANEFSETLNPPGEFFVNESWTVFTDNELFNSQVYARGIAVAAAGNDPTRVVDSEDGALDFARRCLPPQQEVITVVNLNNTGATQCGTSTLRPDVLQDTLAVGFTGQIPTDCATSFAAPRVSWLLAYVEATRTCKSDKSTWLLGLEHRLAASRPSLPEMGSLLLDPEKLIWASSSNGNCGDPNPTPFTRAEN